MYRPYSPAPATISPALPSVVLMPSIDIASPLTQRRPPSLYSTPLLDGWDIPLTASPTSMYHSPTTPKPVHRSCSPYGSPSNPFWFRGSTVSPVQTTLRSNAAVNVHKVFQQITGLTTRSKGDTGSKSAGWKEHEEDRNVWESIVRVIFWAAVVVLLSALMGVGGEVDQGQLTTRAWAGHTSEPSELGKIGWKGVEIIDWTRELKIDGQAGKDIQSIWEY